MSTCRGLLKLSNYGGMHCGADWVPLPQVLLLGAEIPQGGSLYGIAISWQCQDDVHFICQLQCSPDFGAHLRAFLDLGKMTEGQVGLTGIVLHHHKLHNSPDYGTYLQALLNIGRTKKVQDGVM